MTYHTQIIELNNLEKADNLDSIELDNIEFDQTQMASPQETIPGDDFPLPGRRFPFSGRALPPQPAPTLRVIPAPSSTARPIDASYAPPVAEEPTHAVIKYVADHRHDPLFFEVLQRMQHGDWPQALLLLNVLKTKYPKATEFDFLIQNAMLKVDLESAWSSKVKGRRTDFAPLQMLARLVPILVVGLLIIGGALYYGYAQRIRAATLEQQTLQEQAESAMQAGSYAEAIELFNQFLAINPADNSIVQAIAEAQQKLNLQSQYNAGLDAMKANNTSQALQYFTEIERQTPGYLDVKALIAELTTVANVEQLFIAAENAYQAQQWQDAAQQYENLRQIQSSYQADVVTAHLFDAYLRTGQQIVALNPVDPANVEATDPSVAQEFFRKALKLKPGEPTAQTEGNLLNNYLTGVRLIQSGDLEQAVINVQALYQQRPQYLGGYMAEQLYQAYLQLGQQEQQAGNLWRASSLYSAAWNVQVRDNSESQRLLNDVTLALTPTPTSTPTPEPEPVVYAPPAPEPTATPAMLSIADFKGWILFRTDREGGLYIMQADGSGRQLAPLDAFNQVEQLYDKEEWSPDGKSRIYVAASETKGANLFNIRLDLPENSERVFGFTDMAGDEYDPVWSPDNRLIAFVANSTGNDEIWSMNISGGDQRQLTYNGWEWDKHPSWSPDGQKLTFYSNRSGKRQIWVMNADGSAQIQIGNGEYDEWDPIWIK